MYRTLTDLYETLCILVISFIFDVNFIVSSPLLSRFKIARHLRPVTSFSFKWVPSTAHFLGVHHHNFISFRCQFQRLFSLIDRIQNGKKFKIRNFLSFKWVRPTAHFLLLCILVISFPFGCQFQQLLSVTEWIQNSKAFKACNFIFFKWVPPMVHFLIVHNRNFISFWMSISTALLPYRVDSKWQDI